MVTYIACVSDLESSFQRCVQRFPCIESLCSQEHNHSLDHILNIKINHMSFVFFEQHIWAIFWSYEGITPIFYVWSLCWGGGICEVNVQRNYFSSYCRIARVVLGSWPNRSNEEFYPQHWLQLEYETKISWQLKNIKATFCYLKTSRIWESLVVGWFSSIALDLLIYIYIYVHYAKQL
jgi:hypothetical protein